jgi:hypothetical protein
VTVCTLCGEAGPVDAHDVCPECLELNTCTVCGHFTRYTVVDGGGVVCSHCDPAAFRRLDDAGRLL